MLPPTWCTTTLVGVTDQVVGRRGPTAAERATRYAPYTRFRAVLLIMGFAPLVIVPWLLHVWPLPDHGVWNSSIVYFTGVLHVGMTSFFYLDPELREFRRGRRSLFVGWPLAVGLAMGVALSVLPANGILAVNAAFAIWLGWHYTGQQVGVVAMALKGEVATARLLPRERQFIRWTAAVTITGLVRTVDLSDTPFRHLDLLLVCRVGFAALIAVLIWLLVRAKANPAAGGGTWATRAVALTWATAFVAPLALVRNPVVGAATIAAVHSLHYVFLVAYLSRSRRQWAWVGTLLLGAAAGGLYMVVQEWGPTRGLSSHVVPVFLYTMVAAHRVVDTRVWRLREPERLDYMRRSFQFL